MKKRLLIMSLAVVLVCSMAGVGTMAWYTSQSTSTGNEFQTGTLTLGGIIDDEDVVNQFATVSFDNMEPGEPPTKVQTTVLKNVGSLPFYLYRITASELVDDNTENGVDDTILNDVLLIDITIGGEHVYSGSISQLIEENGGYFDPIYDVQPGNTHDMVINAYMDEDAGNEYQGLSMTCDLTVYATQSETPIQGEPEEAWHDMEQGDVTNFSVKGRNHESWILGEDLVQYDWDWQPNDDEFEYYEIMIKHETGDPNAEITEERWETEESFLWWTWTVNHYDESVVAYDMLTGEIVDLDEEDVIWQVIEDRINIKRDAFPADWEGIEVKLSGTQYEDSSNPGHPDESTIQSLPIQYWSFDD